MPSPGMIAGGDFLPATLTDELLRLSLMFHRVALSRSTVLARRLLPAVAFVFGLMTADATASASATHVDASDHALYCTCRRCSGESCCCGPRKAETRHSADHLSRPSEPSGPCMSSGSCQDEAIPPASPATSHGKALTLALGARFLPSDGTPHILPSLPCEVPTPRVSRLDEPPERSAVA